jgi:hypothetical protein
MSKPHSVNGSESEFEFIETPRAPTPTFEKFEDCGVKTTSVSLLCALLNLLGVYVSSYRQLDQLARVKLPAY